MDTAIVKANRTLVLLASVLSFGLAAIVPYGFVFCSIIAMIWVFQFNIDLALCTPFKDFKQYPKDLFWFNNALAQIMLVLGSVLSCLYVSTNNSLFWGLSLAVYGTLVLLSWLASRGFCLGCHLYGLIKRIGA